MEHVSAATVPAGLRTPRRALPLASDERLVALVRSGDERAFEVVYDRHHRPILGFCRHMVGSREEAEDAVQHTFLSAYRDIVASDKPIELRPWLFAIARNRCLSLLRARREQVAIDLAEPSIDGLAATVERREDLRELLGDVAQLPEDQRAALLLAELGALDHAGIAAVLDCPREKVKALVFQARSSLAASREARAMPCAEIRVELATASGAALRRGPLRRHLRGCPGCRAFKAEVAEQRRLLALALPVVPGAALKAAALSGIGGGGGGAASGTLGSLMSGALASSGTAKVAVSLTVAGALAGGALTSERRQDERPGFVSPSAVAPAGTQLMPGSVPAGARSLGRAPRRTTPASPTNVTRGADRGQTRAVPAPLLPGAGSAPAPAPALPDGPVAGGGAIQAPPRSQGRPGVADVPPGQSGNAPGRGGTPPGQSGNAPGQSGNTPGQSGNAPGQGGTPPGQSGNTPGQSGNTPGQSGNAPGQGGTPPGQSGDAPGQGGTPPGQSGNAPGHGGTPPGQGPRTPPGG